MSSELIPPGIKYLANNVTSKQNILGASKQQGARWADRLDLPARAETVFFAGCGYQYSGQLEALMTMIRKLDDSVVGTELPIKFASLQSKIGPNLADIYGRIANSGNGSHASPLQAAVKVLKSLGIEFGYLAGDEPCCGASLYHAGMHKEFTEKANETYRNLKSLGVKRLIGMVPYCMHTMMKIYPDYVDNFDLEVEHFLQVVDKNITNLKLHFPGKVKVTYHDPCQLARYLKIVEEPRRILEAIEGIELVEPDWTKKEWATCCGGGGGFEAVFPSLSQILAVNRTRELLETGAEMIITHCPGCIMQLKSGLKALGEAKVEVYDIAQIIDQAMDN